MTIKNPFRLRETGGGNRWNTGKPDFTEVPGCKIREEAWVWQINRGKYGAFNWQKGMPWSIPMNCILRHAFSMAEGEWRDPESGRPHAAHIACNVSMLIYYWTFGKGTMDLARQEEGMAIDLSAEMESVRKKIDAVAAQYANKPKEDFPKMTEAALYDPNYVPYQKESSDVVLDSIKVEV